MLLQKLNPNLQSWECLAATAELVTIAVTMEKNAGADGLDGGVGGNYCLNL